MLYSAVLQNLAGKNGLAADSVVFTPGVVTLGAAEESYLGFIRASQLSEPPLRQVVAAVRTGNLNCRFCSDVFVAVYNQNIILLHVGNFLHLVFLFY